MTEPESSLKMAGAAPNLVAVCVRNKEPFCGKMYHRYSRRSVPFGSMCQLVGLIDRLCDDIGYPIRGTNLRCFGKPTRTERKNYRETERIMSLSELEEQKGPEGTFLIHVRYRQNATWQGQVTWVDKKQTSQFRSALELMKLIDSALQEPKQPEQAP